MSKDPEIEKSKPFKGLGLNLFWHRFGFLNGEISSEEHSVMLFFLLLKKREFNISDVEISRLKSSNSASIIDNIAQRGNSENKIYLKEIYKYFKPIISRIDSKNIEKIFAQINESTKRIIDTNFAEIFEEGINHWTNIILGRNSGEHILPKEISEFICDIANVEDNSLIYNPFAGIASFNIKFNKEVRYVGQEINQSAYIIGLMRLIAHNKLLTSSLLNEDSNDRWNPGQQKFDLIISNPPFNAKLNKPFIGEFGDYKTIEGFVFENGIKNLNSKGKLVVFTTNGFLFKGGAEKLLRQNIIDNDLIEYIISFPIGTLHYAAIRTVLIVINKNKPSKGMVKFVDAEKHTLTLTNKNKLLDNASLLESVANGNDKNCVREISNKTIATNDYNLSVNRYFSDELQIDEGLTICKFEELANEIKGIRASEGQEGLYISIKDLKNDKINYHINSSSLNKIKLPKTAQIISESCLLIALRGSNLKPTYFNYNGQPIAITSEIISVKIDFSKIDLDYLINELHSKYILNQLYAFNSSATVPTVSRKDLFQINVKIFPLLLQQKNSVKNVKEVLLQAKLKEIGLEDELDRIRKEQRDDLNIKKHNIMQHLNNVKESADLLLGIMQENSGVLKEDYIINPNLNISVGKRFKRMVASLNDALYFVDNLTNELEFEKTVILSAEELLKEAIEQGTNRPDLFNIDYSYDSSPLVVWDSNEGHEDSIDPLISMSKKAFFEIYNNIIENAMRHGFIDSGKQYIFRIEAGGSLEKNNFTISFSNNGSPFPEGMAERFCIKGEKAGKTGNTGIGSWKVCEIVRHYNGAIEILDLKGEEFPVKIILTFPLEYDIA